MPSSDRSAIIVQIEIADVGATVERFEGIGEDVDARRSPISANDADSGAAD